MTEQIKDLIEKIQHEGVQQAQEQAREIKNEATEKAAQIIAEATVQAHKIIGQAQEEAERLSSNTKAMLAQAARDMLLGLRAQIISMLQGLVIADIRKTLNAEELAKLIAMVIKENCAREQGDVAVTIKKEELEKISKGFIERLKEETRRGITLKSSGQVSGGFIISYDAGKSHYDFTDKALAEYLAVYLKPALKDILKEAV